MPRPRAVEPLQHVVRDLAHHLAAAAFPAACPGCGRPAEPVCGTCRATLRPPPPAPPPAGIDRWAACYAYEGVARELVAGAKYRGRHATLRWLAAEMAAVAVNLGPVDVVTWVPTDPVRRRARGVDHARVLATGVARGIGRPAHALLRRRPGPAQTTLPVAARRAGPEIEAVTAVRGTVLLVDDVTTTGATLRECAAALRAGGATRVVAATAARTAPGRTTPGRAAARHPEGPT